MNMALAFHGGAMVVWGFFLFARHDIVVAKIEGKKAAATKTRADVMIWRICGLWVMLSGFACLLTTEYCYTLLVVESQDDARHDPSASIWQQRPLAWLLVTMHTMEVGVKYQALGPSLVRVWDGTRGNIVLATVLLLGLSFGS
jgi:hypothetical protein